MLSGPFRSFIILFLTALTLHADEHDRLKVGEQPDSRIVVPTNQILEPAGTQAVFPGRPVDLAFADGGKTLVSASEDKTALVWDIADAAGGKPRLLPLTAERAERLWQELRDSREAVASLAAQKLARAPARAVPLIRARVRPVDGALIARLVPRLDAEDFKTRDAAYKGLAELGRFAEGSLRRALAKKPGLEVHRRLEELLARGETEEPASVHRQALRAVEVLAMVGTAEARKALEALAAGDPAAELTLRARAALAR